MRRQNITLGLALVLLILGVVQWVRPFSAAPFNPMLMIVAALLLLARYGAVRQRMKRAEMLDAVPEKPLGLSDDD